MSNYTLHWTIDGISYTCFSLSKYLLVMKAPGPNGHHFADNIHKDISMWDSFLFGLNCAFINIPLTAQLYLRLPNDKPTRTTTSPKPESRIWSCIHNHIPHQTVEFNHSSLPSMGWSLITTYEITVTNEFFQLTTNWRSHVTAYLAQYNGPVMLFRQLFGCIHYECV